MPLCCISMWLFYGSELLQIFSEPQFPAPVQACKDFLPSRPCQIAWLPGARREARPFSSICFSSRSTTCTSVFLPSILCSAASKKKRSQPVQLFTVRELFHGAQIRQRFVDEDGFPSITLTFVRSLPVRPLPGCGQRWKAGTEKGRTEAVNGGNSAAVVFARSVMS